MSGSLGVTNDEVLKNKVAGERFALLRAVGGAALTLVNR
jgi:hypothetical protein